MVRTPHIEGTVPNMVEEHPETSTRKVSVYVKYFTFSGIKNFSWQFIISFSCSNSSCTSWWLSFSCKLLSCFSNALYENLFFEISILITDEANLSRNHISNFHKNHMSSKENSHAIQKSHFQKQVFINIWATNLWR